MENKKKIFWFRLIVVLVGWYGVLGSIGLKVFRWTKLGQPIWLAVLDSLSHYTIQTNILALLILSVLMVKEIILSEKKLMNSKFKSAVTLYITFTFVIYAVVLAKLWAPTGQDAILANITHYLTPIAFILDWFIVELISNKSERLVFKDSVIWLVYPITYVSYIMIYGLLTGRYLYPFLNVPVINYSGVMLCVGLLSIVYLITGNVYVGMNRRLYKSR